MLADDSYRVFSFTAYRIVEIGDEGHIRRRVGELRVERFVDKGGLCDIEHKREGNFKMCEIVSGYRAEAAEARGVGKATRLFVRAVLDVRFEFSSENRLARKYCVRLSRFGHFRTPFF